ncbi:hypothetical protein FRC09_003027 [Ceratobasidium sp. 395]|nr:hypothetical protein FRC09_003027 [Ceratobasidium sp. 395]
MPQEETFDLRIAHSSPLFTASPLTGNRSTGWATLCTASGYPCDAPDQSAVYTALADATMDLSFWGSRIEVRGNATGGMEVSWELDGNAKTPDPNAASAESPNAIGEKLGNGLLAVFGGLDSTKNHTLRMITRPTLPSAVMAFEGAVVTVGTGVAGGTTSYTFLDDEDQSLQYTRTGWGRYGEYTSPEFNITQPQGVTNGKFQSSKDPGTSVSLTFNGTQVLLYGPCYSSNGAYTINLNNESPVVYNASINAYSFPFTHNVAGACLRYISPPLGSDKLHYVSMANADLDRETNLDWVVVIGNTGGQPVGSGSGSGGGSGPGGGSGSGEGGKGRSNKSNAGAIAGAVAGSVVLLLVLALMFLFIRRRRQKAKRVMTTIDASDDRKAASLDLLSAQSDIKSLSGDHKPNVLINPSHGSAGSQGNERSYRRIEPFELPPIVDGAGNAVGAKMVSRTGTPGGNIDASTSVSSLPRDTDGSTPARTVSMRTVSPPPASVPAPAPTRAHASQPSTSSGLTSTNTSQLTSNASPPQAVPDLSQISSDVNRILVQLGQIRRRADSNVANGVRSPVETVEEEDYPPGEAPPEYGKHRRV